MTHTENKFECIHPQMDLTSALYESSRCLFCYDAPCITACPTSIDIPLFIRQIRNDDVAGAARTIYKSNVLGGLCGKVCPTEVLCEGSCVHHGQGMPPVEIGRLQNWACEQAIDSEKTVFAATEKARSEKIAIIGAGPAGLACAAELKLLGYDVEVFEKRPQASGLALHGVAPYKIDNQSVLRELEFLISSLKLKITLNHPVQTRSEFEQLENNYDAIFLGIGLGATNKFNLEGAQLNGVTGAVEFIEQLKTNPDSVESARHVVVIGGGNTAMDAASHSARLGAERVLLAYRRPAEQMPVYDFEFELAKKASVQGMFHLRPIAVLGSGKVEAVRMIRTTYEQGSDGETSRPSLVDIPGSEFEIQCDRLILATGQQKQKDILSLIPDLKTDSKGRVKTDENGRTSNPKYFAGGDAANGGAEVVNAVAEGKSAALEIDRCLSNS